MFTFPASNVFLLNPRHAGFLTGEERKFYDLSFGSIISFVIVGIILLGLGLVMAWQALQERMVLSRLDNEGITTPAQVIDLRQRTSRSSRGGTSTTYYVTYAFVDPNTGRNHTHEQSVDSRFYFSVREGDTIAVRYIPDDPTVSRIVGASDPNDVLLIMGGIFVAIDLVMLYFYLRQRRRNRRLIDEGQILTGEITEVKGQNMKGGYLVTVRYSFRSPYGSELSRRESLFRNDLRKTPLPSVGTPVAVLYVDDRLYRVL